jgi:hypothetical protein
VRLDDLPIDELHQVALVQYADDPDMTSALHRLYAAVSMVLRRIIRLDAARRREQQ